MHPLSLSALVVAADRVVTIDAIRAAPVVVAGVKNEFVQNSIKRSSVSVG